MGNQEATEHTLAGASVTYSDDAPEGGILLSAAQLSLRQDCCPTCGVGYQWVEEPGEQSRVLEWVRDCPQCHYSPDRASEHGVSIVWNSGCVACAEGTCQQPAGHPVRFT